MLSDRNKRLAGNLGRSAANYLLVFAVMTLVIASFIGVWCASWRDVVELMFLNRESLDFSVMKWTMSVWFALLLCCNWVMINFAIRAYKRQKEIKWE